MRDLLLQLGSHVGLCMTQAWGKKRVWGPSALRAPCSYVPAYDRHYYIIIIIIVIIIVVIDVFLSCLLTIILISTICSPQLSRVFQRSPNDRNLLRLSAFLKTAYPLYLFHTPLKHATLPRPFTDSTAWRVVFWTSLYRPNYLINVQRPIRALCRSYKLCDYSDEDDENEWRDCAFAAYSRRRAL